MLPRSYARRAVKWRALSARTVFCICSGITCRFEFCIFLNNVLKINAHYFIESMTYSKVSTLVSFFLKLNETPLCAHSMETCTKIGADL